MRINPIDPIYRHKRRKRKNDNAFLDWLKEQPSAIDGGMDTDPDTGVRTCDPCHYRTAANSGTATKPENSAIPMTHAQHLLQHQIGQFNFRPREWWEEQVAKYNALFSLTLRS